jgi:hypothetical protein
MVSRRKQASPYRWRAPLRLEALEDRRLFNAGALLVSHTHNIDMGAVMADQRGGSSDVVADRSTAADRHEAIAHQHVAPSDIDHGIGNSIDDRGGTSQDGHSTMGPVGERADDRRGAVIDPSAINTASQTDPAQGNNPHGNAIQDPGGSRQDGGSNQQPVQDPQVFPAVQPDTSSEVVADRSTAADRHEGIADQHVASSDIDHGIGNSIDDRGGTSQDGHSTMGPVGERADDRRGAVIDPSAINTASQTDPAQGNNPHGNVAQDQGGSRQDGGSDQQPVQAPPVFPPDAGGISAGGTKDSKGDAPWDMVKDIHQAKPPDGATYFPSQGNVTPNLNETATDFNSGVGDGAKPLVTAKFSTAEVTTGQDVPIADVLVSDTQVAEATPATEFLAGPGQSGSGTSEGTITASSEVVVTTSFTASRGFPGFPAATATPPESAATSGAAPAAPGVNNLVEAARLSVVPGLGERGNGQDGSQPPPEGQQGKVEAALAQARLVHLAARAEGAPRPEAGPAAANPVAGMGQDTEEDDDGGAPAGDLVTDALSTGNGIGLAVGRFFERVENLAGEVVESSSAHGLLPWAAAGVALGVACEITRRQRTAKSSRQGRAVVRDKSTDTWLPGAPERGGGE